MFKEFINSLFKKNRSETSSNRVYYVKHVSNDKENYVILNKKRYDFPIGANVSIVYDKIYVNGKRYKDADEISE